MSRASDMSYTVSSSLSGASGITIACCFLAVDCCFWLLVFTELALIVVFYADASAPVCDALVVLAEP